MNDLFDIFIRKKAIEMLIILKNRGKKNCSRLAKESNCTYSHAVKTLEKMAKAEIIKFEKKGRAKEVSLTKLGEKIAENLQSIKNIFIKIK